MTRPVPRDRRRPGAVEPEGRRRPPTPRRLQEQLDRLQFWVPPPPRSMHRLRPKGKR